MALGRHLRWSRPVRVGRVPRRPRQPTRPVTGPVTLADAERLGVTRYELSTARWTRLGRGVRLPAHLPASDPDNRIAAVLAGLPSWAVLGGWAALRWQGVPALDGRTGPGGRDLLPIMVHAGPRRHLRDRASVLVDRSTIPAADVVKVRGVWVTRPVRAVFDEACRRGAEEGVVVGDAAWRAGKLTGPEVEAYVASQSRTRGLPAARVAAPLLSPHAKSAPESRLRYVWVVEAGLPVPLVNPFLVDDDGEVVGEPDLLDVEAATVGEYDGSQHRELRQHTSDNVREEGFEGLNLTVVRATALDLWPHRAQLLGRLRDGWQRGDRRDRSRDRFGVRRRT